MEIKYFEHRDYTDFRIDIIQGELTDGRQFLSTNYGETIVYKKGYNAMQKLNERANTDDEILIEEINFDMQTNEEEMSEDIFEKIDNIIYKGEF